MPESIKLYTILFKIKLLQKQIHTLACKKGKNMKNIKTSPEFMNLSEDEIVKALDEFEDQFATEEDVNPEVESDNPIVNEVARLINEYTTRFDELVEKTGENEDLPEEIFTYEPEIIIERVAYEIFMDAVHDSMQEADDE